MSLENNTRLKPKLVCLNITKDNITVLPLQNNNSVLQLQTIPVGNTNQEISDAPVNRFQEQGIKIINARNFKTHNNTYEYKCVKIQL